MTNSGDTMTRSEAYQFNPDWGTLATPLDRDFQESNGVTQTVVDKLHQLALEQFRNALVPGRKQEDWKYTPLRELLKTPFAAAPADHASELTLEGEEGFDATRIVFVNGHYRADLSDAMPGGVWMGTLTDALKQKSAVILLEEVIARLGDVTMSPFEALNVSLTTPSVCLLADPEIQLDQPLHFIHLHDGKNADPTYVYPYKLIGIARNTSIHIVESFVGSGHPGVAFTNAVNHIHIASGAHLWHHRLQNEHEQNFHVNMTRVFQQEDSEYSSIAIELGSKLMRNTMEITHRGTGITANLYGVMMGRDRQHMDTQSFIDHAHPHCHSNELYKGVFHDYARGVFNGKIIVRPDAQKTNAFQQNSSLLLSPNAIMDSKPQLEIFADDVKCSHGATIGQLDEEAVFYLRSRGLTHAQASALLQQAFVGEVLDKCGHEEIKNYLYTQVTARQDG